MKTINKYIDEISGREFATADEAIESEKKNGRIAKLFSFWTELPGDKDCCFANGEWCYQRTDYDYLRFVDALIKAVTDYEPWIAKQYKCEGGLQRVHMGGGYIIGRYLDDGHSELYSKYCTLSNICPKCFREWGQAYYANNCKCRETPRGL